MRAALLQTNKTLPVISVFDPAIDHAQTGQRDLEKYAETRDASLLKIKTDCAAAVFHVRRLPVHTMTRFVETPASLAERRERAFMAGVERIEGLRDGDGRALPPKAPGKRVETATGETYWWSEPELEELIDIGALDKPTLDEIGGVALTRAGLRRGSAPRYRLPASLADEWDELVCRLADTQPPTSHPSSAKPEAEPTTPPA